jgi:N-carbamoylputrescine amidase
VRRSSFIPPASAGIPTKKPNSGAAQLDAWRTIQRAHAIANASTSRSSIVSDLKAPLAQATQDSNSGVTLLCRPLWTNRREASNDEEEILVVECDPARSEDTRRNWPFLRDRRIDAYQPILNRWLGE